jgi:hypothetical protein
MDTIHSEELQRKSFAILAPRLVQALYRGILGREADAEGLATYTRKLTENGNLEEVLADLLGSAEFRLRSMEALSPDLVNAAFKAILRRAPDPEGLKTHNIRLIKDHDIMTLLVDLVESPEFQDNFRRRIIGEQPAAGEVRAPPGPVTRTQLAKVPFILFTHHKCASIWLGHLLERYCAAFNKSFFNRRMSGFAPPADRNFDVLLFTNSDYQYCVQYFQPWLDSGSRPPLHVIRNPLDIVVSAYYSHLATHPVNEWPELARQRDVLRSLDKTSGMLATWVFLEQSDFDAGVVGPLFALRRQERQAGTKRS